MRYLVCLPLLAAFLFAACDGGQAEPTPAGPAEDETVSIFDLGYDPATLSVSLGQSVAWSNDGQLPHTVTFADGPDSGNMSPGASFEHTFDGVGQFDYTCTIHPAMRGVVNVSP